MKKIISSKRGLIVYSVSTLLGLLATVFVVLYGVYNQTWKVLPFGIFMLIYLFTSAFCLNQEACFVWVEDNSLKRKGLLFGYKKEYKFEEIKRVETAPQRDIFAKEIFCVLNESEFERNYFKPISRYICFDKTSRNELFLREFWDGEISKYGE